MAREKYPTGSLSDTETKRTYEAGSLGWYPVVEKCFRALFYAGIPYWMISLAE